MTEGQFQRAMQINSRITDLTKTLDRIKETRKHCLWYAYNAGEFGSEWELTPEWAMRHISDILDKHDLMIRQEIKDEIKKLEEEIKAL